MVKKLIQTVGQLIGFSACFTMAYSMVFWEYATWGNERYIEIPIFLFGGIVLLAGVLKNGKKS